MLILIKTFQEDLYKEDANCVIRTQKIHVKKLMKQQKLYQSSQFQTAARGRGDTETTGRAGTEKRGREKETGQGKRKRRNTAYKTR